MEEVADIANRDASRDVLRAPVARTGSIELPALLELPSGNAM